MLAFLFETIIARIDLGYPRHRFCNLKSQTAFSRISSSDNQDLGHSRERE